jgi:dTDP-4-amino-4,6-dideoxygalactose transaminase
MLDHKIPPARAHLQRLETKFEDLTEKHAVVGSTATATYLFALRAWINENKIPVGAEVIVSGLCPSTIILNLMDLELVPVFADIDADTLQVTAKTVAAAKTDKTVAVFIEHFGGYPAPIDEIHGWCKARQFTLMDDASQCLPTEYKHWECGDWPSDMTFFNFSGNRLFTGCDGGVVCLESDILARACATQRRQDVWADEDGEVRGYKAFLTEPKALQIMNALGGIVAAYNKRSMIWGMYQRAFDLDGVYLPWDDSADVKQSCSHYALRLESARDYLVQGLAKRGIAVPRPIKPVYKMDIWKLPVPQLPVLEEFIVNEVSLPISHDLNLIQVQQIIEAVKRIA